MKLFLIFQLLESLLICKHGNLNFAKRLKLFILIILFWNSSHFTPALQKFCKRSELWKRLIFFHQPEIFISAPQWQPPSTWLILVLVVGPSMSSSNNVLSFLTQQLVLHCTVSYIQCTVMTLVIIFFILVSCLGHFDVCCC